MFNQVEGFFQFSQVDFNLVALMTELPGGGFCLKSLFDYEVTAMWIFNSCCFVGFIGLI